MTRRPAQREARVRSAKRSETCQSFRPGPVFFTPPARFAAGTLFNRNEVLRLFTPMTLRLTCASALFAILLAQTGCRSNETSSDDLPAAQQARAEGTVATLEVSDSPGGKPAPNVALTLQTGQTKQLHELKGNNVVLFFYPKDNTSGCRIEAQGFRDAHDELRAADTIVLGVSLQGAESHQSFIDNENLQYDLVVDSSGDVARAFGVEIRGDYTARDTILIDKEARVRRVWRGVSPRGHASEVLEAISKL